MKTIILAVASLFLMLTAEAKQRYIKKVETVSVETTVGTCPRLPYLVQVTYSDGKREWRQTRWTNSMLSEEQQQADYPLGKKYSVTGYIVGDNTTDNGYPITANVTVVEKTWDAPKDIKAQPLPLADVTLEGQNRLTHNRDLDVQRLLTLDITQQLYNYRDTYGLPTEGYTVSDGWDSPTTKLKGHGTGHYMSALAFAYASSQDEGVRQQLLQRIERIVNELRECQERTFVWSDSLGRYFEARDYAPEVQLKGMKGSWKAFDEYKKDYRHYGYGYLNAIPAAHPALIEYYRAYNNEEWVWAPYYTIHKQLAGLIDIANNIQEKKVAEKAYQIAKDMGLWVWNRLHYRTFVKTDGTMEERRESPGNRFEMWNMYIAGEVGGMEEALSRLSEMTDDPQEKEKLLEAAGYFDAPAFFNPLSRNIDDIRTRHANQHIPMITGALRSYRSNHNPYYYNLACNFWQLIQGRYTYAMGGVGNGEMWQQPYSQMISMTTFSTPNINETCCAYNLAKLTKDLNCYNPDNAVYMDYYERVLYNQIVGSLHPDHWAVTYHYAVGTNAEKPYGNETPHSTCCGGTGVENHVKYQEAQYFVNDNTLWVGLYLPSSAKWKDKGVTIRQECEWPAERSVIKVAGNARFSMKLRVPYWATEGFNVKLNGKSVASVYMPSSYVEIPERQWSSGDVVEIAMPFTKHINWGPDKVDNKWVGAIMNGPLVMATPDIKEWKDAEMTLSSDLSELNTIEGFVPDYAVTGHSTHYLRLDVPSGARKTSSKKVDYTSLK